MRRGRRVLRAAIWTGTAIFALLVGAYVYFTRPEYLRTRVLAALGDLTANPVRIGDIAFAPRTGLQISGMTAALAGPLLPGDDNTGEHTLQIAHARVRLDLAALLVGRIRVRAITLRGLRLALVCDPAEGAAGAGLRIRPGHIAWRPGALEAHALPTLRLEDADFEVLAAEADGPRLLQRWLLAGSGRPTAAGYELRLTTDTGSRPLVGLDWDAAARTLRGRVDWLDLDVARVLAPVRAADWLNEVDARGRLRVREAELVLAATEPDNDAAPHWQRLEIEIAEGRCAIAAEEPDDQGVPFPPSQRFLQVRDTAAVLRLEPGPPGGPARLDLAGEARLYRGPVRFEASVALPAGGGWRLLGAAVHGRELPFPTAQTDPAFVRSRRLPPAVLSFFSDYRPDGRCDLDVEVQRGAAGDPDALTYIGTLVPRNIRARYFQFPYDFTDVNGSVRFAPAGIRLEAITARHHSGWVRADGVVNHSEHLTGFDLCFRASNVPLDADLFAALPQHYRPLWERTAPLGACDAFLTVRREEGRPETGVAPAKTQVEARLTHGSLLVEPGRRLQAADGVLTIAGGIVQIHELHGYLDDAAVRISGALGVHEAQSGGDLHIEVADMPVHQALALEPEPGEEAVRFEGQADVWARLGPAPPGQPPQRCYAVQVKRGVLTGFDPRRAWDQVRGWVRVLDGRSEIVDLAARQGGGWLRAAGRMPDPGGGPVKLDIDIGEAPLENLIGQMVPRRFAEVAAALGLAGPGAVRVGLRPRPDATGQIEQSVVLRVRAERMCPRPLPLEFRAVEAHAVVGPGALELVQATGTHGAQGRVRADGQMRWADGPATGEFRLTAEDLLVGPELIESLPDPAAKLLRRLAPRGQVQVVLERIGLAGSPSPRWDVTGTLEVADGRLDVGLPLEGLAGTLRGRLAVNPAGQADLAMDFQVQRGTLAGRPIAHWEGRLRRIAGDPWIALEGLRGRLCDGDAAGSVRINGDTSDFELSLTVQNVGLSELLPRRPANPPPPRRGEADANIFLRGRAGQTASRQGGGEVRVRGGSFLHTPVLSQVAQAGGPQRQRISDDLDLAELRFVWQGELIRLTRVDIQSRDLRLVGEGTWNLESDAIDLTLVGAHPRHWRRVAVLSDLVDTARRDLVQYHVQGTMASPRITVEPLYKLTDTLRALLGGG